MERMETDRRGLLSALAGAFGLAALGSAGHVAGQAPGAVPSADAMARLPWPYRPLEADAIGNAAFAANGRGGCMYAVFEPIAGAVARQLGAPYSAFPFAMFAYGAGGVAGWGSLCGALNGAAAAMTLLSPRPQPLISELYAWYEREALPDVLPVGARFPNVTSVSGSVLCHVSLTRWANASGKKMASPERAERCGALAASVARKAVLLLNAQGAAGPSAAAPEQATAACLSCHGTRGVECDASGRMRCAPCHSQAELKAAGHPGA
ncbi:MAG: C-GCAxxG-C-C family protein [Thermoanaerobaculaceae bacterium]